MSAMLKGIEFMKHGKNEKKKINKKKMSKKKLIILGIVLLILAPILYYGGRLIYVLYLDPTPTFVSSPQDDPTTRPADIPDPETSGIENVVLFGVDSRDPGSDSGRTDSIIIATIDTSSKAIKLTSVMRDLYVEMGDNRGMDRVNAAYAFGGPQLALKTLNKNFGLDLKYYAIIDFRGFQELVDQLDGIDVDVKDYEVNEINKYILEVNGKNSTLLKGPGFQHLNGQQALSYARIRHVGDGDFQRTERQRTVLQCLFNKAKQTSILKVPDLITTLASYVQTNVPLTKVIGLASAAAGFNSGVQQMRVPVDGYYAPESVYGASVLVPDIKANAMFVKEFIYNIKVASGEDMPAYMQNDFHLDDSATLDSKPKPNIPDYNTPNVPEKSEDEQQGSVTQPGTEQSEGTGIQDNQNPGTDPSSSDVTGNEGETGGSIDNGGTQGTDVQPGDSSETSGQTSETSVQTGETGTTPATP